MKTVAEGVATEEQLQLVRALGCDRIQGYHLLAAGDRRHRQGDARPEPQLAPPPEPTGAAA